MGPRPSKCIYINDECEHKCFMYYVMCKCLHRKVYEYFYDKSLVRVNCMYELVIFFLKNGCFHDFRRAIKSSICIV